jgi:hypothetical protein
MSCLLFHGCQTIGPVGVSLWGKYYRFLSGQTIEVINTPWIRDSKQARHTKCIYVSLFIKKPKNHKTTKLTVKGMCFQEAKSTRRIVKTIIVNSDISKDEVSPNGSHL